MLRVACCSLVAGCCWLLNARCSFSVVCRMVFAVSWCLMFCVLFDRCVLFAGLSTSLRFVCGGGVIFVVCYVVCFVCCGLCLLCPVAWCLGLDLLGGCWSVL